VGVDRTRASGTGFTGQYPPSVVGRVRVPRDLPDELLLFFHHVPYGHVLHSGTTVIQHIYDTHFAGAEEVSRCAGAGTSSTGLVGPALYARVAERLDEQLRCARSGATR
jgi:alpha-glucuronidase